jgi:Flagellar protein FliT
VSDQSVTLVDELVRRYAAVREITARLIDAVQHDHTERLGELFDVRGRLLDSIDVLLVDRGGELAGLAGEEQARARDAARMAHEQERQLRALLSSGRQEVPDQLAQVRTAMVRLGGYGHPQPGRPEIVDRRG